MSIATIMVPMRDGVRLATDVHLPEGTGPFPVVMERTPYGRAEASRSEITAADRTPALRAEIAAYFSRHGYAVVYQDTRGRYGSEGVFVKYLSDGLDGFDTAAWLIQQPWCDGRFATMGLSYAAHTQAALGCLDPPGLQAQILDCGGFVSAWRGGIRNNGAFELKQATWAFKNAGLSPEALADPVMRAALASEDIRDWFARMPWKPGHSPLRHHPDYEAYLFEQWTHGAFDAYWQQLGIWTEGFHDRYSRVPMVHMSSWFDPYPVTATENYVGLKGRGPQRLILGPWTHGDRSDTCFGDVEFGPDAPLDSWAGDWRAYRLRFFDHVLKGAPLDEPPVRVFVMGGGSGRRNAAGKLEHGGRWITAADWPLPDAEPTAFHLHNDGLLSPAAPAGVAAPLSYDFDPAHPVPTIGGALTSLEPVASGGAWNQTESAEFFGCTPPYLPLSSRSDVLAFQTAPLSAPVQIVGPIEAELWVATDGPDTDFTAKLIDVHPPSADYPRGYAMILCDGILRLRYAEDPSAPRLRTPGEVVRIEVSLGPIANLFLAGHRIRLDISSSNFPKFDVNPNTGEPDGMARRKRVAVNTVFADAGRPSRLVLPVTPARSGTCNTALGAGSGMRMIALSPAPASLPAGRRVYAIGDIHGCAAQLDALHAQIAQDMAERPVASAVLIHVGDYVDRGPDTAGVIARLIAGSPIAGIETVNLLGNHEHTMLEALGGERAAATDWLFAGGRPSLESYGVDPNSPRESWPASVPAAHIAFLRNLPTMHREGGYAFVHGGVRPGVPLHQQAKDDLLRMRSAFLYSEIDFGAVVVHGHTPVKHAVVKHNRIAIDTGAVFGGPLTCLVLEGSELGFLTADPVHEPVSIAHR